MAAKEEMMSVLRASDPADPCAFRAVMGQVPTNVAVVCTAGAGKNPQGFTVSSFSSVSLDPPLVAFNLNRQSPSLLRLRTNGWFSINVLSQEQEWISTHFSTPKTNKFSDVAWSFGTHGQPLIAGALACLECELWEEYPGGDHSIIVGEVVRMASVDCRDPLVFHRGSYACLRANTY